MSTRSAKNPRTQNREYTGATRKGASSAKPARAAASSVRVVPASSKDRRKKAEQGESLEGLSKEEKRARKSEMRAREDRVYDASEIMLKSDSQYKKYRKIFWVIIGFAVVFIVATMILTTVGDDIPEALSVLRTVLLVLSYAALFVAIGFDLIKVRPVRNYYRNMAEGMSDRKISELIAASLADQEKKQEAKAAKKKSKGAKKKSKDAEDTDEPAESESSPDTTAEPADEPATQKNKKRPKKNQRSRH